MEDIFPSEEIDSRQFVDYQGKKLCVEPQEDGRYKLIQLLSTNPQDYLDPAFSPGAILPYFDNQSTNYES